MNQGETFPYKQGDRIEFYDAGCHDWIKGQITFIHLTQGYFVFASINYWSFGKTRNIKIYRDDWLRIDESKVQFKKAIAPTT